MDKILVQERSQSATRHKIILDNREKLCIAGVKKVLSINTEMVNCLLDSNNLCIVGHNLHMEKLDVESGNIEISGQIDSIKYLAQKQSIFKRIFK